MNKEVELIPVENKTLNILGENWTLTFANPLSDDPILKNNDGYCDDTVNNIVVEQFQIEEGCKNDLVKYAKHVVRHEIIHAFLSESGLSTCSSWACNEEMIDYFAKQIPKMMKVFKQADAL